MKTVSRVPRTPRTPRTPQTPRTPRGFRSFTRRRRSLLSDFLYEIMSLFVARRKRTVKPFVKGLLLALPLLALWHVYATRKEVDELKTDLGEDVTANWRLHSGLGEHQGRANAAVMQDMLRKEKEERKRRDGEEDAGEADEQSMKREDQFSFGDAEEMVDQVDGRSAKVDKAGGEGTVEDEFEQLLNSERAKDLQKIVPTKSRFLLYRALGNDLPPRHERGQTLRNVKFVLEHEPKHEGLERRWLLNRIVRVEDELPIVKLLVENGERFTRDPVDFDEYAKVDFNFEVVKHDFFHTTEFADLTEARQATMMANFMGDKNQYIIHNNQARNKMLELGMQTNATYVLPFDGNCFLNKHAWQQIRAGIAGVEQAVRDGDDDKTFRYFAVGMARMTSNDPLKDPNYHPETAFEEPQLIFHKTAKERFNEELRYGRRPKVELLWRLRVKGAWDRWTPHYGPWKDGSTQYSDDVPGPGAVQRVGWVARMFSGMPELEVKHAANERGKTRASGIEAVLAEATRIWAQRRLGFSQKTLMWYDEKAMQRNREAYRKGNDTALTKLVLKLREEADREMENDAVYAVTHKTKIAPSGDRHDYISAAPYSWPNPNTEDGFPYVHRDGQRAPGTRLYGEQSEMYDRTRLASFSRNCTVLALAGYFTGEKRYNEKAAKQVRTWFINEETRMNPNLHYAQMTFKTKNSEGSKMGLIDFVSLAPVLDAVRLLEEAGALTSSDIDALRDWAKEYATFLSEAHLANLEYRSTNNHGTLFDVQAASVSAFIGDFRQLLWHTSIAKLRMTTQFAADGSMPREMKRRTQLHYIMYGMQAWVWLARMSERVGANMWEFGSNEIGGPFLKRGMRFAVPYFSRPHWMHKEDGEEDMDRMLFLYFHGKEKYPDLEEFSAKAELGENVVPVPRSVFEVKPIFHDYFLVPPFWNLAMYPEEAT